MNFQGNYPESVIHRKIMHIVGARPNFMKVAPLMREMSRYPQKFDQLLVHTGQHYDDNMSKIFFENIELPNPNIHLGVGSGSHAQQTARIMQAFEPVLLEHKPDWIIVVGDVNSTIACALTAAKLGIRVAHVEAGLRSFDRTMPEEINRILTDHIADLLFTTESSANKNLNQEGIPKDKIHFVGNVMIDTLVQLLPKTEKRSILAKLGLIDKKMKIKTINRAQEETEISEEYPNLASDFVLVTLHRPSNVDSPETLREILLALNDISKEVPIIFPAHPRTRKMIEAIKIKLEDSCFRVLEPLGYLDFLALTRYASLVITDSGGIQEETTFLGIPCLTIRPNTERPVTIEIGTNQLVSSERKVLIDTAFSVLKNDHFSTKVNRPPLWDGKTAQRIIKKFLKICRVK